MKRLISVALITALAVTGCTGKKAPKGDEFKIGIAQEFENFNPLIMSMSATSIMFRLVGRTLVNLDAEGKWVPQLAKEIPTLENKKAEIVNNKFVRATWEILDNASWGDGTPITCDDFAFALEVAASPNVSIAEKESFTQVTKIEKVDGNPKKCLFTYDKIRWDFSRLTGFYPLPKHVEEPVFRQFGKENQGYEKNSKYVTDPTNVGLYNGPYVVSEVKLGSHVSFTKNPKFYGEPAKISKIIFKYIPSTNTLDANLLSGNIDMISSLGLSLEQALTFEEKVNLEKLPYEVLYKPSITYEHIDLNLENPILSDVKVRRALLYAYNREELVKSLFKGKQQAAIHSVAPIDPWYTDDPKVVNLYPHSKVEAEKLLEEAGWKLDKDGYRYKAGKKLELTLMTTAGNKTRENVEAYLQNQWRNIGIEVSIKNEPARVFFSETMSKRKFPAMGLFAWISTPENSPKSTFHSKNIPNEKNGWSGQNYMGWRNATVDKTLESLDTEMNADKRKTIMTQVIHEYTSDVPVLPLYYRSDNAVIPKNLKNFRLTGHSLPETNEAEKWVLE